MAMPNATLYLDTGAVTTASPSKTVTSVDYTDGMNLETVHCYHAALTGLAPSTTYNYLVSDGGSPAEHGGRQLHHRPHRPDEVRVLVRR